MSSRFFFRVVRLALLVVLLVSITSQVADARRDPNRKRSRGFNLTALPFGVLNANRVFCGINVLGEVCVDPTNSPVIGGGFWPRGTQDQYIFNSGLQLGAVIPSGAGFEWAGDTIGVYFMDPRGDQNAGDPVTQVFNSLDPDDNANWPDGAYIWDRSIYDDIFVDQNAKAVSQQDLWVRIWDGNPLIAGAREHPMGVLVEERGLAWNFPTGNEDIVYFVYTFYNITARNASAYANLDPAVRDDVAELGVEFQDGAEDRFNVQIPDDGYAFENMFAAFFMDPDVEDASHNYSSVILPFDMAIAYKNDFLATDWAYPADIFGAPFVAAPGFVGVKYLKSPIDPTTGEEIGLTMFSNTLNQATGFPDPRGVVQMWRYISGNTDPALGDNPCTFANSKVRKLCFLYQNDADTRFFQSSGPFTLEPGQSATIVVAYVHAAPVAAPLVGKIGTDIKPEIPFPGDSLFADPTKVRLIDSIAGWVSANDDDGDGVIEQEEVVSVRRSLLDKALVAQEVFDKKFLLPASPEGPEFFLVPGDGQVSVVWQPSPTEDPLTGGDPFFAIAGDPTSTLFDPNFREFDVEGYRIYRGRTQGQLELIAQFDYSGTMLVDQTGAFDYGISCAPELGIGTGCPVDFLAGETNAVDIVGEFVQVPVPGGRVELASGDVLVVSADTAVTGGGSGFPILTNAGVPFAFIDTDVRNSFTYTYAVTAFDVNSFNSGPSSLESARVTRSVTPRGNSANLSNVEVSVGVFGRGSEPLDQQQQITFDNATGTFTGGPPPTSALQALAVELFAPTALVGGSSAELRVDSVKPGYYEGTYYMTLDVAGQTTQLEYFSENITNNASEAANGRFDPIGATLPSDPAAAAAAGQEGLPFAGSAQFGFQINAVTFYSGDTEWHQDVDGAFWGSDALTGIGGSRWFMGDDETVAMPGTPYWRGELAGVTAIQSPQPNWSGGLPAGSPTSYVYALFRRLRQATWYSARQADLKFYWGSTPGTLDSVIDVTHDLPVEFSPDIYGPGWGFRNDIAGIGTTFAPADGIVTAYDFAYGPCFFRGLPSHTVGACETRPFAQQATLEPVDINGDDVADGNGFALYFNHEFYIFQTDQLPSDEVWTHRSYFALVDGASGAYTLVPEPSNAPIPGLTAKVEVTGVAAVQTVTEDDLADVHTVPDPYYVTTALEATANTKVLKFVNLPDKAIIRIYTVSGVLVDVVEHRDVSGGGEATWDLRNRNNQFVASGVYFFHVEAEGGPEKIGRFTVVTFAQ